MHSLRPINGITILRTALRGFQGLAGRYGVMGVKANMIGVSLDDTAKVWINSNLALNHP